MHWILQENIYREKGLDELVSTLEHADIQYSIHKVVPFVGELIPDIHPINPVIVFGTYGLAKHAKKRGWVPGAWANENFEFPVWHAAWGDECLNADATIHHFSAVPFREEFFMRPVADSKVFAGQIFTWDEYEKWVFRVADLKEDVGTTLKIDTPVLVSTPKQLRREYRLWIVDAKVATASLYKIGDQVRYDANVDPDVIEYAEKIISQWTPDRAFVLDVGMIEDGTYRVIEVNCLNAAGLYAANVGRLVERLEAMGYEMDLKDTAARLEGWVNYYAPPGKPFGMVGITDDSIIVYMYRPKRKWRTPSPAIFEGWPVEWKWSVGRPKPARDSNSSEATVDE